MFLSVKISPISPISVLFFFCMMTHKERFYATIERKDVDSPASWLGILTPRAAKNLIAYFQVDSLDDILEILDDDLYPVELPYHSPTSDAIYMAFDFARQGYSDDEHRTLNSPGFFQHYSDLGRIDDFDWPDPVKYIDPEECRQVVAAAPQNRAILGVIWSAHFQDACAAFGMETALVKMLTEPDMFQVVIDSDSASLAPIHLHCEEDTPLLSSKQTRY